MIEEKQDRVRTVQRYDREIADLKGRISRLQMKRQIVLDKMSPADKRNYGSDDQERFRRLPSYMQKLPQPQERK